MGIFDRLFGRRKEDPAPQPPVTPPLPPPLPSPIEPVSRTPVQPEPVFQTPRHDSRTESEVSQFRETMTLGSEGSAQLLAEARQLLEAEISTPVADSVESDSAESEAAAAPSPDLSVSEESEPAAFTGDIVSEPETATLPSSLTQPLTPSPDRMTGLLETVEMPIPGGKSGLARLNLTEEELIFLEDFGDMTEEEQILLIEMRREESHQPAISVEAAPSILETRRDDDFTAGLDGMLDSVLAESAPPAPVYDAATAPVGMAEAAPATSGLFDDDLGDFDEAFDSLIAAESNDGAAVEAAAPGVEYDQTEIRELFANIASNYIRPVKNFIFELRTRPARKEWLEICQPAMSSLGKSAEGMGLTEVSSAIGRFDGLLAEVRAVPESAISGEHRDRILALYDELTAMLPQTFTLGDEGAQSEGIIINSLLKQIPDVGKVTIDKLYRAGLTTLESYFLGAKEDIAVASGLPIWLATRIVDKFKQYQQQVATTPVDASNRLQREKLAALTDDLHKFHDAYEAATAAEWSNPAAGEERKFYRQARQDAQLQINVVLAELQAVDLIREIQRLSFEKRIQRLQEFLASLAAESGE